MKYLAAALAMACLASAHGAPPAPAPASMPSLSPGPGPGAAPEVAQPTPVGGLRQTLRQYHPSSGGVPRELSPQEREELRRQLSEQGGGRQRRR